jgi:hypothetical protein
MPEARANANWKMRMLRRKRETAGLSSLAFTADLKDDGETKCDLKYGGGGTDGIECVDGGDEDEADEEGLSYTASISSL